MGDFVGLEGGSPSSASSGVPATPAPGRSTLTSRLAPPRDRAPRPETEAAAAGPAAVGAPGADAFGVHLLQGGAALASGVADQMSRGFGRDLSGVRVHTDGAAGAAAASLDAAAFTVGQDVFFGAGAYQPGTPRGDALIAHEVAHTIQQGATPGAEAVQAKSLSVAAGGDAAELEADAAAAAVLGGATGVGARLSSAPAHVARKTTHLEPSWSTNMTKPNQPYVLDLSPMGYVFPDKYTKKDAQDPRATHDGHTEDWTNWDDPAKQLRIPKGTTGRVRIFIQVDSGPKGATTWFTAHHEFRYDNTGDALKLSDLGTETDRPPVPDSVHIDPDWKPVVNESGTPFVLVNPNFVGPNQTSKQTTNNTGEAFTVEGPNIPLLPNGSYQQSFQAGTNSPVRQTTNAAVQQMFQVNLNPEKNDPKKDTRYDLAAVPRLQIGFPTGVSALSSKNIVELDAWVKSLPDPIRAFLGMVVGGKLERRELLIYAIGHASKLAGDALNQDLSVKRAAAVQKYLQDRMGETIVVRHQATGEQLASGPEDGDKAEDRQVEVLVMRDPDR